MAIFKETVPKEVYDELRADYRDLLAKYHSLRATHQPVQPLKIRGPQPDSAQHTMQVGERAVRDPRLAAGVLALVEQGLSEKDALVEAARLLDIAKGKTDAAIPAPRKPTPIPVENFGPAIG